MHNSAVRMRTLIKDLLNYARLNNSSAEPIVEIDLEQLTQGVLQDLDITIAEKQAQVSLERMPVIFGQASLWRQLLQNLIANALKFQPIGQTPVVKLFTDYSTRGALRLHCCDNGIGLNTSDYRDVFKPFYRLHGRHHYQGNGIGLAIVKKVADLHKICIDVHSTPGSGSCFILTWPENEMESTHD